MIYFQVSAVIDGKLRVINSQTYYYPVSRDNLFSSPRANMWPRKYVRELTTTFYSDVLNPVLVMVNDRYYIRNDAGSLCTIVGINGKSTFIDHLNGGAVMDPGKSALIPSNVDDVESSITIMSFFRPNNPLALVPHYETIWNALYEGGDVTFRIHICGEGDDMDLDKAYHGHHIRYHNGGGDLVEAEAYDVTYADILKSARRYTCGLLTFCIAEVKSVDDSDCDILILVFNSTQTGIMDISTIYAVARDYTSKIFNINDVQFLDETRDDFDEVVLDSIHTMTPDIVSHKELLAECLLYHLGGVYPGITPSYLATILDRLEPAIKEYRDSLIRKGVLCGAFEIE